VQGSVYFSSKTFESNPNGWSDSLRNNYYHTEALIPVMPWLPENPNHRAVSSLSTTSTSAIKPTDN
jgi:hypothetical protein